MANMRQNNSLNKDKLKLAFDFFDENHDGSISVEELQRVFSGIKKADVMEGLVKEVDSNSDGLISFEEFVKMMGEYVDKRESAVE